MNPKTCPRLLILNRIAAWLLLPIFLFGLVGQAQATLVSGDISGTWNKAGSPYIVIDHCQVPPGQRLIIEAGVTVIIGSNLTITVRGQILAEGTCADRITIKGPQPTVLYNTLAVNHGDGSQSRFAYCDFSNAQTGLSLTISSQNATMQTRVENCTFNNCSTCLYGYSHGYGYSPPTPPDPHYFLPHLDPAIRNCRFMSSGTGCRFYIDGIVFEDGWHHQWSAPGYASPTIVNCIFESISGKSIHFEVGDFAATSYPIVVNSLFTDSGSGVETADPYDLNIRNCIIQNCATGVLRTGSLSSQVGFNCFFNNQTNFVGYPPAYGQPVLTNNNGTPCDVAFNIFQDPRFQDMTNCFFANDSPCIDAGDDSLSYRDACSPPSLGTDVNDMGPHGGPGACNWLCAPIIVAQPKPQRSCLGQAASFSVVAAGAQPLSYQWYFNGMAMDGQTSSNLNLANLQANQAGPYWVVVTNTVGSVTSAPAQLDIRDACLEIRCVAGLFIHGEAGATYVLKYTTDIANTNFATWTPLATNTMTTSPWYFVDLDSPFSPKRFYGAERQR